MQDAQTENAARWQAWRTACEQGQDRAHAYDTYLHPATRVPCEALPGLPDCTSQEARQGHRRAG